MKTFAFYLSCIFFILLSLTQCKKEKGEYSIQGKITHARTGNSLSSAAVNIQKKTVANSTYSAAYSVAANTSTDAQGNYSMVFERENFAALKLVSSYPQFISKEVELNVGSFKVGTPVTKNVQLYPEAFIQVNLHSNDPQMSEIAFTFLNAHFDCVCCTTDSKYFPGVIDTSFSCKLYGDQWLKYKYQFSISGQDSLAVDSIWCPAFETQQLNLSF